MSTEHDPAARLKTVLDVAKAMISERDLDSLLQLILREATQVVDADRGSLFLVDPRTGELWAKIAQGLAVGHEIRVPPGVGLAGHVAATCQPLNLPDAYADSRFNRDVDRDTGYHTRSLLCVPMTNMRGESVGVIQVLNKRSGVFDAADADLLMALAGQAGVAIENALLHVEIQQLFEGFVKGAVMAIESRDPTTAGHSERVARLTLGLCDAVERHGLGRWKGLKFSAEQRMEIRYAALLHDFGKVGVRERVLVKANKLYPEQMQLIEQRFAYAKKANQVESLHRQLTLMRMGAPVADLQAEEASLVEHERRLDRWLEIIHESNKPTVLPGGYFHGLTQVHQEQILDVSGRLQPLLTAEEVALLSIPKGTLSADERAEIESHVSHTWRFLNEIPWTRNLQRVPEIAYGHHEKLNGNGYPRGLHDSEIKVEPRMMAIADIYDALTASDRPYKKAVPHDLALQILDDEAQRQHLDSELLEVFISERVAQAVAEADSPVPRAKMT